jgi:hypothetical protein
MHALLPSGTASNEALHAEINGWLRQTRQIHQATLRLKFLMLAHAKQRAHRSALHNVTARQMAQNVVLARILGRQLWDEDSWRQWCSTLRSVAGRRLLKAALPLVHDRRHQTEVIAAHIRKRPAAAVKPQPRKRTVFTLRRERSVRTGGVKNTVFRRPARSA